MFAPTRISCQPSIHSKWKFANGKQLCLERLILKLHPATSSTPKQPLPIYCPAKQQTSNSASHIRECTNNLCRIGRTATLWNYESSPLLLTSMQSWAMPESIMELSVSQKAAVSTIASLQHTKVIPILQKCSPGSKGNTQSDKPLQAHALHSTVSFPAVSY